MPNIPDENVRSREPELNHPVVGRVAVAAIVLSMLAIVWAKVEFLGTRDIERTLTEESANLAPNCTDRLAAVAFNRWATGFSQ